MVAFASFAKEIHSGLKSSLICWENIKNRQVTASAAAMVVAVGHPGTIPGVVVQTGQSHYTLFQVIWERLR